MRILHPRSYYVGRGDCRHRKEVQPGGAEKADIRACGADTGEQLPKSRKVVELADAVEEVESCSACYGYLIPALDMLKQEGLLEKLHEKIHIGQGFRGKTGELGIGHCTRNFRHHLEGCPPVETEVYKFLKDYRLF